MGLARPDAGTGQKVPAVAGAHAGRKSNVIRHFCRIAYISVMITRGFYLAAGWLALLFGAIGIVLPLLPTVPFVILAAYCFARAARVLSNGS